MGKVMHSAADFLPARRSLSALRKAAKHCRGCPLYKNAIQTVFGEGNKKAELFVVGEIPGDKEDKTGIPFCGPAGTFLRQSLESAGLDVEDIYFTNVVKHFKFQFLHNKRLHRSPVGSEIRACTPWLQAEIETISPKIILCLGSVAAKTLVKKDFHLKEEHGKWFKQESLCLLATFHPSAILRAPDEDARHRLKKLFLKDLKKIHDKMKK